MKIHSITISFLLTSILIADEAKPYPVQDIPVDSSKFENLYQTVAKVELESRNAKEPKAIQIVQHLEESTYLISVISVSGILTREINHDDAVAVLPESAPRHADGTSLALQLVKDGIYEYISVTGAKVTVPKYTVNDKLPMTKEVFIERLKSGESWYISTQSPGQRPVRWKVVW